MLFRCYLWAWLVVFARASFNHGHFTRIPLYDITRQLSEGCMEAVTDVKVSSSIQCTVLCRPKNSCTGATWNNETRTCYLHTHCGAALSTQVASREFSFFEKSCNNGGVKDGTSSTCQCVGGWRGAYCDRRPYSCLDVYQGGYMGTMWVQLDIYRNQSTLVNALCTNQPNQRVVSTFMFRSDGSRGHNKTYSDFVSGYFMDNMNYWMGLEAAHTLTQRGHNNVTIKVFFQYNGESSNFVWDFEGFHVGDAGSGYSITYARSRNPRSAANPIGTDFNMSFSDCFADMQGVPFSTWDHEATGYKCAGPRGAGWWFKTYCSTPCMPLGLSRTHFPGRPPMEYIKLSNLKLNNAEVSSNMGRVQMKFSTFY